MKDTTGQDERRAAPLLCACAVALAALALPAAALAAPLPQLWTACFVEESGFQGESGANQCNIPGGIAADPNVPGHVYVDDGFNDRINEFDAWGAFVKAWGWGVRDGSLEAQTCGPEATPPSESCQEGISGPQGGQLGAGALAVDSAGDVYVTGDRRIQKFGPGGGFLRAWGGGVVSGGATGTGDLNGTATVSNLVATEKAFRVGQTVTSSDGGIPAGTTVTEVTTGPTATLTLSQPATTTQSGVTLSAAEGSGNVPTNEVQTIELFDPVAGTFTLTVPARQGHASHTTAPIGFEASAEAVQEELEEAGGMAGNVEVSGPAGGPYEIGFKGALADTDVPQLEAESSGFAVGAGSELRCDFSVKGGFGLARENVDFSYQWLANGVSLGSANGAQTPVYTVRAADEGKALQCRVAATNAIADFNFPAVHAAIIGISAATVVPASPSPVSPQPNGEPPSLGAPDGSLDGTEAKEVVCNAGGWSNSPTQYTYQWLRNGAPFGSPTTTAETSVSLVLSAAEQQQEPAVFQCAITAENAGGASARSSDINYTTGDHLPRPLVNESVTPELLVPAATPATTVAGASAAEICTTAAECQEGINDSGPGGFGDGSGIAVDTNGTLANAADDTVYVGATDRIQSFDSDGSYLGEIPFTGPPAPEPGRVGSLAVDQASGDLYFAYRSNTEIAHITGEAVQPDVHRLDPGTGEVTDTHAVAIPRSIATAPNGSVYVFDKPAPLSAPPGSNRILRVLKFDSAGSFAEVAVQNEGPHPLLEDQFEFTTPGGLATGSACFSEDGHDLYATNSGGAEFTRAWGPAPEDLIGCPRPEVPPAILAQYAVFVDDDTATVRAKLDPRFWEDTSFYVQYGTAACIDEEDWEGECVAEQPAAPGTPLGAGVVSGEKETPDVVLEGLTPDTAYRYRFAAQSGGAPGEAVFGEGGTLGEDGEANGFRTFPTSPAPESCDNQALRSGTPSENLPDCRAYEQVSPVDKNGDAVIPAPAIASRDGEAVSFASRGAFADAPVGGFPNGYGALRDPSGWPIHPLSAPVDPISAAYAGSLYGASEDTMRQQVGTNAALAPGAEAGAFNLYVHDSTSGAYEFVAEVPGLDIMGFGPQEIEFAGASADGSRIYFTSPGGPNRLDSTPAPRAGANRDLYEFSGGELRLVGALGGAFGLRDGSDVGRPSGASAPAGRAVSADGSRVYWQSDGDLYLREGEASALIAKDADFEYASADGNYAFLTSSAGLTPGASPEGTDLYRYDAGSEELTDLTPTAGEADVLRVLGTGEDGTHVYFLANGALAPGASAGDCDQIGLAGVVGGECNLYAWHEDEAVEEVRLIGRIDASVEGIDTSTTGASEARVSANGRYLGFLFGGAIAGPDPFKGWPENPETEKPFVQAYLYDRGAEALVCASCPPADGPAGGLPRWDVSFTGPELGTGQLNYLTQDEGLSRNVSDRGELFFHTAARLARRDENGAGGCPLVDLGIGAAGGKTETEPEQPACTDVYRYRDGDLRLLSAGDDSGPAFFGDAAADGADAFIVTAAQLVGQDQDAQFDLYDARVEGGIAAQNAPEPAPCASPEECRGEGSEEPAAAPAATPAIEGAGNLAPATSCKRLARGALRQARKAKALRRRARRLSRAVKRASEPGRARAARRKARRLSRAARKRGKAAKRRSAGSKRCRRAARRDR
jgi:hypothetical protein